MTYCDEMYPNVVGEYDTVEKLLQGFSIARFGDGELKITCGAGYKREPENPKLTEEIRDIIVGDGHPECLVGIWTKNPNIPKFQRQKDYRRRFFEVIRPDLVTYYSSTITRPDVAPWIQTPEYARLVESLWRGKTAVVVCEHKGSMHKTVRMGAKKAYHVLCPHREAYAEIDQLERDVLDFAPDIAILSAGPTATCLANRLAGHGIQAIDFGSAGGWLRRLLP